MMRVVIFPAATPSSETLPTTSRDLKMVPAGSPSPIFSAMQCNPSGVQLDPSICPMPKREVEQGYFLTNTPLSNSETICLEMLTVKRYLVGVTCNRQQVVRQASGILFLEFIKFRLEQLEVKSAARPVIEMRTYRFIRSCLDQFFHQHLGIASALVIFFAACGRQVVGRALGKTALGLEISERLRREREQFAQVQFLRLVLDELNELASDALVFVRRADVQARQLAFFLFGVNVQRYARDRIFIDLKNKIISETFFDHRPRAFHQFIGLDRRLGQQLDRADVFFLRGPDLLVFVRVNEGADAVVGKNFREEAFIHCAVDHMDARNTGLARSHSMLRFG